jgi:hypothetical protein
MNGRIFLLDGLDYPERLNAGVELTDRMVDKGFADHTALIGNGVAELTRSSPTGPTGWRMRWSRATASSPASSIPRMAIPRFS